MASGDSVNVTITATAPSNSCPTITDTAHVQVGTQTAQDTNTVSTTVTGCAPNLQFSKTGPYSFAHAATTTFHTLSLHDALPISAAGVTVTDTLDSALTNIVANFS